MATVYKFRIISITLEEHAISNLLALTQPAFTYSKLTIETLEQRCEICSKLTMKPPKQRRRRSGVFIVNFEHISHLCSSVSIFNFEHVIAGWELETSKSIQVCQVIIRELLKKAS